MSGQSSFILERAAFENIRLNKGHPFLSIPAVAASWIGIDKADNGA